VKNEPEALRTSQNQRDVRSDVHSGHRGQLTPFERHILQLVASGMRRKEIAHRLNRSPQTISNSLTIAKDKLGARTIAEAAALITGTQSKSA
jgi:DNA-binding NarL/FixJ family response regulator